MVHNISSTPKLDTTQSRFFHGTRVAAEIQYIKRNRNLFDPHQNRSTDLVLLQEIEFSESYDLKVESVVGYNGDPGIMIPHSKRYKGSIKKLVTQFDGEDVDNFDEIIRGFEGYKIQYGGYGHRRKYIAHFDILLYFMMFNETGSYVSKEAKVYKLHNCIPVNIKRNVKYNGYVVDEVEFEFSKLSMDTNLF